MQTPPEEATAIVSRAFSLGLKMPDVLRQAQVARGTWWRIRRGEDFHKSTITRLERAIDELVSERAQ